MALIKCEECGKDISDKATQCINCGVPINSKPTMIEEKTKFCESCGSKVYLDAVICPSCGVPCKELEKTTTTAEKNISCSKCGSNNVSIQVVNESTLKNKHHSIFWWIFIGWWWVPLMWCVFFIPKLFIAIFGLKNKKQKIVNKTTKKLVCQQCGNVTNIS